MMHGPGRGPLGTETLKARSTGKTLGRFWGYAKRYWLALLITLMLMFVSTWTQVLTPDLIGQAADCYLTPATSSAFGAMSSMMANQETAAESNCWFDSDVPADPTDDDLIEGLTKLVLILVVVYFVGVVVSGIQFYTMAWAGQNTLTRLRVDLFKHLLRLSLGFYSKEEVGDLMSRITNDTDTIQQIVSFGLVQVSRSVLVMIWVVINMLNKSIPYTIVSLAVLPFMAVATVYFAQQARKAYRVARQEIGEVNADLQESFSGVREVQAFSREDENIEEFRASNAANRDANIRAAAFTSALPSVLEALSYVSTAIVIGVGGYSLLTSGDFLGSTISLGLIITFMSYVQQFNQPIQQISVLWANIQSAIAGAERIFDLMDADPEITDKPDAIEMPPIQGRVVFAGVHAHYKEDEPVLCDINLTAEPGQTIAIVGPTGAGKTTMVNLIPRFYDVGQGSITIDGMDVRDVTRASLRSQIGIVLQDTFLFSESVMENIRYGRPDATDAHPLWPARRHRRGSHRSGQDRARRQLHRAPARQLQHRAGRAGRRPQPGPAPAYRHRAGHPWRCAPAHPRRGDQFGRYPHRTPDPGRAG
jgi:ATP-binding cassette subfamily B protein